MFYKGFRLEDVYSGLCSRVLQGGFVEDVYFGIS